MPIAKRLLISCVSYSLAFALGYYFAPDYIDSYKPGTTQVTYIAAFLGLFIALPINLIMLMLFDRNFSFSKYIFGVDEFSAEQVFQLKIFIIATVICSVSIYFLMWNDSDGVKTAKDMFEYAFVSLILGPLIGFLCASCNEFFAGLINLVQALKVILLSIITDRGFRVLAFKGALNILEILLEKVWQLFWYFVGAAIIASLAFFYLSVIPFQYILLIIIIILLIKISNQLEDK
jgi:hypothetical protein